MGQTVPRGVMRMRRSVTNDLEVGQPGSGGFCSVVAYDLSLSWEDFTYFYSSF